MREIVKSFNGFSRMALPVAACLSLTACSSLSIPLGSLTGKSSDDVVTGSLFSASKPEKSETASTSSAKTAQADKPFTLDAPAETTGTVQQASLRPLPAPAAASEVQQLDEDDRQAVQAQLAGLLGKSDQNSTLGWSGKNGGSGLLVRVAQEAAPSGKSADCHDVLISLTKGSDTQWFKSMGCKAADQWRLGPVTNWRQS